MKKLTTCLVLASVVLAGCSTRSPETPLRDDRPWTEFPEPTVEQKQKLSHHNTFKTDNSSDDRSQESTDEKNDFSSKNRLKENDKASSDSTRDQKARKNNQKQSEKTEIAKTETFSWSDFIKTVENKQFLDVTKDADRLIVRFRDYLQFPPGQAQISSRDEVALRNLVSLINDKPIQLVIRGHTSNLQVGSENYTSRKELSQARAESVADYLREKVSTGQILKTVGMGAKEPVVPNTNPDNRARNRRVDFILREKSSN